MKALRILKCSQQTKAYTVTIVTLLCVLLIGLSGCAVRPPANSRAILVTPAPVASPAMSAIPAEALSQSAERDVVREIEQMPWVSSGEGRISLNGVALSWLAVAMGEDFVDVVYLLTNDPAVDQFAEIQPQSATLNVNDHTTLDASEVVPLANWNGASLGVLRFPGRPVASQYLQIEVDGLATSSGTINGVWRLPLLHNIDPSANRLSTLYLIPNTTRQQAGSLTVSFDGFRSMGYSKPPDLAQGSGQTASSSGEGATPTPVVVPSSPDTAVDALMIRASDQSIDVDHLVAFDIVTGGGVTNVSLREEEAQRPVDDASAPPLADDAPLTDTTVSLEEAQRLFPHPLALPSSPPLGASLIRVDYLELTSEGDTVHVVGLTYDNGLKVVQQTIPPGRDPDQIVPAAPNLTRATQVHGIPARGNDAGVSGAPTEAFSVPGQIYWHDGNVLTIVFGDGFSLEVLQAVAETLAPAQP